MNHKTCSWTKNLVPMIGLFKGGLVLIPLSRNLCPIDVYLYYRGKGC